MEVAVSFGFRGGEDGGAESDWGVMGFAAGEALSGVASGVFSFSSLFFLVEEETEGETDDFLFNFWPRAALN